MKGSFPDDYISPLHNYIGNKFYIFYLF